MGIFMKIKKYIIFGVLFLGGSILMAAYAVRYPQFFFGKEHGQNSSIRFLKQGIDVPVEVARDPHAWSRGLMFRTALPKEAGMLFVFPNEAKRSFWMKYTLMPLDMFFISRDKKIVTIIKNADPCTTMLCPHYDSTGGAMYVLEVSGGFADNHQIKEGDIVEIGF